MYSNHLSPQSPFPNLQPSITTAKPPRETLTGIFAFPPHRGTLGGTAYFIVEKGGNILIDCPAWTQSHQDFVANQGGVRWLFITNRNGIAQVGKIQADLGCQIIIQEQEAYLLPEVEVVSFGQELNLASNCSAIWTPGYSPGSSCLYYQAHGGVLFTGRHLLPNSQGKPTPLQMAKTFHWSRQLRSVAALRDRFSLTTLNYICPAANTGYLRGKGVISQAYQHLSNLDLGTLKQLQRQL